MWSFQVQYQNLVNELIKNIIIFSEDIFPGDGGHTYEKFISRDSIDLDADMGDAPSEAHDDVDSEQGQSEDGKCCSREIGQSVCLFVLYDEDDGQWSTWSLVMNVLT